jgi:hypothetical protein
VRRKNHHFGAVIGSVQFYHCASVGRLNFLLPKITGQSSKQSLAADGSKTLFFFRPN